MPALFARWGPIVADAAGVGRGARVLDVGCGTGALTLAVAERVGPGGTAVGLDLNPGMLAVARTKPARIEWVEAPAEALPFPDRSFDAVVSQFALMFFADRVAALREMWRVLRPDGRLAVAVCDAVERSPGYAALASLLDRLFGRAVGDAFRAPFALGDAEALSELARQAGLPTRGSPNTTAASASPPSPRSSRPSAPASGPWAASSTTPSSTASSPPPRASYARSAARTAS